MQPAKQQALRILKSWHTIEFFQPYDIPTKISSHSDHIIITQQELQQQGNQLLPWLSDSAKYQLKLKPEKKYNYILYLGVFDKADLNLISEHFFGQVNDPWLQHAYQERNTLEGNTCFAKLYLSPLGEPDFAQMSVSTLPWSIGRLVQAKGNTDELSLEQYDRSCEWLTQAMERVNNALPRHPSQADTPTLTYEAIEQINLELQQFANFAPQHSKEQGQFKFIIDWQEVKPKKQQKVIANQAAKNQQSPNTAKDEEQDEEQIDKALRPIIERSNILPILNSFYIQDLERVMSDILAKSNQAKTETNGIDQYLSMIERKYPDLYTQQGLALITQVLAPQHTPLGRWPSEPHHHMSLMQQFAINTVFSELKDGGLLSVNGPPGTGKTTLLRDIIANNIVERAKKLSEYQHPRDTLTDDFWLQEELCGYEMLVASSNNLAVENISKELPLVSALGASFQNIDHIKPVANQINGIKTPKGYLPIEPQDQCWGLISAVLGRANNCHRFTNSFFFDKQFQEDSWEEQNRGDDYNLLNIWRWRKVYPHAKFHQVKQEFIQLLEQYQKLNKQLEQFDNLRQEIANLDLESELSQEQLQQLQQYHALQRRFAQTPTPKESDKIEQASTQLNAYYQNPELNQLRSELFICALKLHRSWLFEVMKHQDFLQNLFQVKDILRKMPNEHALKLWQLLFMIVPVVSTTFASLGRMLSDIKAEQIGYLMIDEAGQAIPQAAVGGIWRAKRTLVVGDPQQIEPVFTTPIGLTQAISQSILAKDSQDWNPQQWSVQQIADRANPYGCYLEIENIRQWVGIPLWVHRRCIEPMFSIANKIAYNDRMIHGAANEQIQPQIHFSAGLNRWIASQGTTIRRQYHPNLGEDTLKLLAALADSQQQLTDVYVITPFREVKQQLVKHLRPYNRSLRISKEHFGRWLSNNIGTVHTFQGKENDIVILVLGCDHKQIGAARWASTKPNLLNVAITRAKKHLFVIGDPEIWQAQRHFDLMSQIIGITQND